MPRITPHPIPKKRFHGARWRIYWKWNKTQYTIPTEYFDKKKPAAVDPELRKIAAALVVGPEAFPDKYRSLPAVVKYVADRYGTPAQTVEPSADQPLQSLGGWLPDYESFVKSNTGRLWADYSMKIIYRLDAFIPGGIGQITPALAESFLDLVLNERVPRKKRSDAVKTPDDRTEWEEKQNLPSTRNRALAICSRCFGWAKRTGRVAENPFKGIPRLKEAKEEPIVYCTRAERDRLIGLARELLPDWVAVPIAFYTGMRMAEIYRMRWQDILWDVDRIIVPISKTQKSRVLEMNGYLRDILKGMRDKNGAKFVVPDVPDVGSRRDRAQTIIRILRRVECEENQVTIARSGGGNGWQTLSLAFSAEVSVRRAVLLRWGDLSLKGGMVTMAATTGLPEVTHALTPRLASVLALLAGVNGGGEKKLLEKAGDLAARSPEAYIVPGPKEQNARVKMGMEVSKNARLLAASTTLGIPDERIGWNAWRHTFASLLVQEGLGLDLVSAWMGNTPEVCRRHYAQFIPRDRRNTMIDRL